MAEEKAAAPEGGAPPAAAPAAGGKPILLYVALLLNMVAMLGFAFMIFSAKQKEKKEPGINDVIRGEHEAQAHDAEKHEDFVGKTIPMETFLVNVAGSRGHKLLKVNLELELDNDKVQEEIEKRKPQVRDIVIMLLSSKTYENVASKDGKDHLRREITDTLNSFLTKGKIKNVYFTEYIYN